MNEDHKEETRVFLPKFKGKDFLVWKAQVEAYLAFKKKLWVVLNNAPAKRSIPSTTDEVVKTAATREAVSREAEISKYAEDSLEVRSLLINALVANHVRLVMQLKTAKEIWERLISVHEQRSSANRITLQQEFFNIKMKKDERVADYIARVEHLHMQLRDIGVNTIDDQTLISTILAGLPNVYFNSISNRTSQTSAIQTFTNLIARPSSE